MWKQSGRFVKGCILCYNRHRKELITISELIVYDGKVLHAEKHTWYSDWYWDDPKCEYRARDKYTVRKFKVNPPVPLCIEKIAVNADGEQVACYPSDDCLIEYNAHKETERRKRAKGLIGLFSSRNEDGTI